MSNQKSMKPSSSKLDFLPKGYLSWSQIDSAINYPKDYYKRYFLKEEGDFPPHLKVGKIFHDIPENDNWKDDLEKQGMAKFCRTLEAFKEHAKLPNQEQGFEAQFDTAKYGKVKVIGFFDGYDDNTLYEIKTSPFKLWDRKRVESHGQLKLYALVFWKLFGKLPTVELRSFKLVEDPKKSKLSTFKYNPTLEDVTSIQNKIDQALDIIKEMSEVYNARQQDRSKNQN